MVYEMWQSDLITRKVPITQPFKLETIMTNDVEITAWASEGLPGDELSIQNGLLTTRSARWPLCIDPQMQAVTWIKTREGKQLEGKVRFPAMPLQYVGPACSAARWQPAACLAFAPLPCTCIAAAGIAHA